MQVREVSSAANEAMLAQTRQETTRSPTPASEERSSRLPQSPTAKPLDKGTVETVVNQVQKVLDRLNVRLVFNLDDKTGEIVVKVIDPKTQEVIRQIPPEELLRVREKLDELMGILFEARV